MRQGFGMIQVLFFMVILSGLLTIAMKYSSITVKQTEDLYIKEQAELFMKSSIELALLGIGSHDHQNGTDLIENIRVISDDKRFIADINITKYYIFGTNLDTEESNGMISMNIVVETNNTNPKNSKKVRLSKRSLQRL
jgi:hypothetical protein